MPFAEGVLLQMPLLREAPRRASSLFLFLLALVAAVCRVIDTSIVSFV